MGAARLRKDLQVTPLQDDDGVLYYDVSDPQTGGVLRLYDFEWLMAERLDGERSLHELSSWARESLGFEPTPEDLEVYAERLQQLGLCDLQPLAAAQHPDAEATPPAPPALDEPAGTPTLIDMAPPTLQSVPMMHEPAAPEAPPEPEAPEAPAAPERPEAPERAEFPEAPATLPALQVHNGAAPSDDVMGHPMMPAGHEPEETYEPRSDRRPTLMMPTIVVPQAAGEPVAQGQPSPEQLSDRVLSDRPTIQLAPISGEAPTLPLLPEPARITLPPTAAPPIAPAEVTSAELPAATEQRPVAVAVTSQAHAEESARPQREERSVVGQRQEEEEESEAGGAGRWIVALIILLAVAAVLYFALVKLGNPSAVSVQIKRAQPHEVTKTISAAALVKRAQPVVLRMEGGGVLASVVSEGAEVSAGMSLAILQSQAKIQKEISDLHERLTYYQRRRDLAAEKGEEGLVREAEAKVNEKQERLASAEIALKKAQLLAVRSGKVSRVLVHAGELVAPGSEIIEIADRHLSAEMRLQAADAQGLKIGEDVALKGPGGVVSGRVASIAPDGDRVVVQFELPDEVAVKAGDDLRLVRGRIGDVEILPSSSVIEGDTVYVLSQRRAARRKVTVIEHEGDNVMVTGLRTGDEVIVSNLGELREGQLVRPAYGGAP